MATLTLRVRGPSGATTIKLSPTGTLDDLKTSLLGATQIAPEEQEIRSGHPPRQISADASNSTMLSALGIRSGETLIVSRGAGASSSSAAPPSSATAASATQTAPNGASQSAKSASGSSAAPAPGAARNARPAPAAKATMQKHVAVDGGFVTLRVVPDDNQCLFHSVGMLLQPHSSDAATEMRRAVAKIIHQFPDEYSEIVLGRPPDEYVSTILRPNSWGGAIELSALSKAFNVEIASVDVQTGRLDRYGEGQHDQVIIVCYSGIHYDAVTLSPIEPEPTAHFPYDLGFDVLSFASGPQADAPLFATIELSKLLKAAHYYTDTATFTLKCELCGTGLTGEQAAREHAQATGHSSFGEYA